MPPGIDQEDVSRMAATEPAKIRNIAVAGHRGVGKTSLVEALLFQAGKTNRLGTIEQGTTVSDWDEHEQKRVMSLSGSLCHLEWHDRKINLVDTPGDAGFQADTYAALRVVEGVVVVLSGVMGVEVNTSRVWNRAEEYELSRVVFVNMLDRERADFYRVLEAVRTQLSDRCVAIQLPIGAEHELTGVVDLLHMCAYIDPSGGTEGGPQPIPEDMAGVVQEHREKLLDAVVETDEDLMARYLEGEELDAEAVAHALKAAVTRDELYPVGCGVASKNLGTTALLDLLVEGVPSPASKGTTIEFGDAKEAVFIFKTIADPFTGRISLFRVLAGPRARRHDARRPAHAREGASRPGAAPAGQGLGAGRRARDRRSRRRREAQGRRDRRRARRPRGRRRAAAHRLPRARHELRHHAEGEGRRGEDGGRAAPSRARRIRRCTCGATRRPASSSSRASRRCRSRSPSTG